MQPNQFMGQLGRLFLSVCDFLLVWSVWLARFLIALGLAYAAAKALTFPTIPAFGFNIPYPKVTIDAVQLAYMAGVLWLLSKS